MPAGRAKEEFDKFVESLTRPAESEKLAAGQQPVSTQITIINAPQSCRIYIGDGGKLITNPDLPH